MVVKLAKQWVIVNKYYTIEHFKFKVNLEKNINLKLINN